MYSRETLSAVTGINHAQLNENFKIFNSFHQNLLESIEGNSTSKQLEIQLEKC